MEHARIDRIAGGAAEAEQREVTRPGVRGFRAGAVFFLYDVAHLTLGLLLIVLHLIKKICAGKPRRGIGQRFGFYPSHLLQKIGDKRVIWIHAVSVGETRTVIPLIRSMRKAHPDDFLLLSNVTETGHATAGEISELDGCIFFPFDISWVVKRALRQVRPSCVIIVETEIWPNFVRLSHLMGTPVFLVNGRISDRSYPRYLKLRFLLRPLLKCFAGFCMQSPEDAERIVQLGAPRSRIEVTRSLKFDVRSGVREAPAVRKLRRSLKLREDALVWVAGSTHAGEEEALAGVYGELRRKYPHLFLLLVPRHPERCEGVAEALHQQGFSVVMRSRIGTLGRELEPGEILVGDTLGEMLDFYACSELAFVGGSLVNIGGHNLLEPVSMKKPVLFGPHVQNFKEISRLLVDCGGGVKVKDRDDLLSSADRLLGDADLRRRTGEAGHLLLERHAGATAHTFDFIREAAFVSNPA